MVIVVCKKEFIIFREGNNVKKVKKRFEGKQKSVKQSRRNKKMRE